MYRDLLSVAMKRICVIGSGPAAFFTAGHLLKSSQNTVVDIVEKMPTAHGLVRYGVAPDHQDVKNVENKFIDLLNSERLQFFGGIEVGHSVKLSKLRKLYNAVVVATGCERPKSLGIEGEFGTNILSSHDFITWYNGHPDSMQMEPDLACSSNAVILGQGNVALDVARILLTPPSILEKSDISDRALSVLRKSEVQNVFCVGRRGLANVSFTIKELRDITKIQNVDVSVLATMGDEEIESLARPRKRLMQLCKEFQSTKWCEDFTSLKKDEVKNFVLDFNKTPCEFLLNEESLSVESIQFKGTNDMKGETVNVPTGLVVKCIGYEGVPIDKSVPFDSKKGVYENDKGKVDTGLYCSGWAKTGPVGVIAATLNSSQETADCILRDLDYLPSVVEPGGLKGFLQKKNMAFVSGRRWLQLYEREIELGKMEGKPRKKFESYFDIMNALNGFI